MENKSYKIIGRNSKTKIQKKKRVYTSEKDFLQYKDALIKRYKHCYGIAEVYELVGGKWKLLEEKKLPEAIQKLADANAKIKLKATELRIGNYVQSIESDRPDELELMEIVAIQSNGQGYYNGIDRFGYRNDEMEEMGWFSSDCELIGIPLTEEWLLKFGAIKTIDEIEDFRLRQFELGKLELIHGCTIDEELYIVMQGDIVLTHIKSVHQLQNLYFALTGEELKIIA